jgi:hypothetical protein
MVPTPRRPAPTVGGTAGTPATDSENFPLVVIAVPALFLVIGSVGLWPVWRRPEALQKMVIGYTDPRSGS